MLLGRTANGLYWMHRYIERAENIARLVDTGHHVALTGDGDQIDSWTSILQSAGAAGAFQAVHGQVDAQKAIDFMLRDESNSSSVLQCFETARSNGRMVRTALTREVWENINTAWMNLKAALSSPVDEKRLPELLNLIKRETALIRGAFVGTMLRDERFDFARLGTFIERADNTARILDVKYYVLLPGTSWVGSALDTQQWESILRSVSAHRSYRWVYDVRYKPANIIDFLVLNPRMPRSLAFCATNIVDNLDYLERDYGVRHACHDTAGETLARLKATSAADIIDKGLHEFLIEFISGNNKLGNDIADAYRFY
ncbi:alpha-E domain-containing protein [Zhengella sp. ZM62]|uniref:alpha-E domain-containing protein n=1 Tax=Zhengella sedimenti TaxID=3390035 RepID=UPI0039756135